MMNPLQSVCREAGCSTATVSRVLNDSPLVNEKTRDRVLAAVAKHNYRPNPAARSLRVQRTDTIGVLSPYVGGGFFTNVLLGADTVAMEHNYHLITAFSHGVEDEQKLLTRFVRQRRVDALIVINLDLPGSLLAELSQSDMPMVSVDQPAIDHGIPSVSIDNHKGGYSLMQHMLEHGYRDIAIFAGPHEDYDSRQRLEGCHAAVREAGVELPDHRILEGEFIIPSGKHLMQQLLADDGKLPEAIVSLNDDMAIGAMGVLQAHGIAVPGDVTIVGFDDSAVAESMGLTTMRVPFSRMGKEAVRLALAALDKDEEKTTPEHVVVPSELVVRRSCGC